VLFVAGCLGGGPTEVQNATLHHTGGLAPTPAPGSTCTPQDDTWHYDAGTQEVTFQHCLAASPGAPDHFTSGQVTLSHADAVMLEDALLYVRPAPSNKNCGGDVDDHLEIETFSATTTYTQCAIGESQVFELFLSAAPGV